MAILRTNMRTVHLRKRTGGVRTYKHAHVTHVRTLLTLPCDSSGNALSMGARDRGFKSRQYNIDLGPPNSSADWLY